MNAEAGHTESSFQFLEKTIIENEANGKKLLFALSMDEMKIMRSQYVFLICQLYIDNFRLNYFEFIEKHSTIIHH